MKCLGLIEILTILTLARVCQCCLTIVQKKVKYWSCKEHLKYSSDAKSGFYEIYPFGEDEEPVLAYCEQDLSGGGWTVIQMRDSSASPRVNFYRNMQEYENGFGNEEEYWLGLKAIHQLTTHNRTPTALLIELTTSSGEQARPQYGNFIVAGPYEKYKLTVSDFTGTGGDSLIEVHNGNMFSTYDHDMDKSSVKNCALLSKGGFWYNDCHSSNLNGFSYKDEVPESHTDGITWYSWAGFEKQSMAKTKMMIRDKEPSNFV